MPENKNPTQRCGEIESITKQQIKTLDRKVSTLGAPKENKTRHGKKVNFGNANKKIEMEKTLFRRENPT